MACSAGGLSLMARSGDGTRINPSCMWFMAAWVVVGLAMKGGAIAQQPPPDASWIADAAVTLERTITDAGLGAVQGVVVRDGKVYAYGDVFKAEPRVGVIREYTSALNRQAASSGCVDAESR